MAKTKAVIFLSLFALLVVLPLNSEYNPFLRVLIFLKKWYWHTAAGWIRVLFCRG
jgi:hypothetical protein